MTPDQKQLEFVKRDYALMIERKLDMLIEADDLVRSFNRKQGRYPSHGQVLSPAVMDKVAELRWKANALNPELIRLDTIRNELSGLPQLKPMEKKYCPHCKRQVKVIHKLSAVICAVCRIVLK